MSQVLAIVQELLIRGEYLVSRHGYRELAADDILPYTNWHPVACCCGGLSGFTQGAVRVGLRARSERPSIHVMWVVPKIDGAPAVLGNRLLTGLRALVDRLHEADKAIMRRSKEFVHEGKHAAEVAVDLIEDDTG